MPTGGQKYVSAFSTGGDVDDLKLDHPVRTQDMIPHQKRPTTRAVFYNLVKTV